MNSQEEILDIDYAEIKEIISDPENDFFYPALLKKYNDFDSTFTMMEYAIVYYGFSFQDDYIKNMPDETRLNQLARTEDFQKIIEECDRILAKNPVSLNANLQISYALFKQGKPEQEWRKYQQRYRGIRNAIVYSGDGLTAETAFKVIYISDEYNIISTYFNIPKVHSQALKGYCDYFEIDGSEYYKASGMYFDISRKLIRQQEIIEEKN
ncbi:DUF4919 domain-containing protein [Dysgonomonas sp. 520]|uniref:DUF4919 domain-containing protein n=1 Tax=Dysgonomonas sp. 520 TaxID=2302931 RepID=UPI0013D7B950|nr:DUF4919 domain-containing protein [Dysgonomonas sp. 520]